MKLMSVFSVRPGCVPEAAKRFLSGKGAPPPGVTLLGRWHKSDCSGGFSLFESDDPVALYQAAAEWTDLLETHSNIVVEDAQAGPVLAKIYGK